MPETTLLGLPLIEAGQAQKHITHNEALMLIDGVIHLSVVTRLLSAPPAAPADGERYLVGATPSVEWLNHAGDIAFREFGNWRFAAPRKGWRLWVEDEQQLLVYTGTQWQAVTGAPSLQNVPSLGINTTADTTNRLALSSIASLFNHAGSDHRLKINKAGSVNTASFLFQSGFSGRAEIGLTGDDNFHFKVSADGNAWVEALAISRASGQVSFNAALQLTPLAADPSSVSDGQLWYNSTLGKFRKREAGVTTNLSSAGGSGPSLGLLIARTAITP